MVQGSKRLGQWRENGDRTQPTCGNPLTDGITTAVSMMDLRQTYESRQRRWSGRIWSRKAKGARPHVPMRKDSTDRKKKGEVEGDEASKKEHGPPGEGKKKGREEG